MHPHSLTQTRQSSGYLLAGEYFRTKQALTARLHTMLFSYAPGSCVTPGDEALLLELLRHHPRVAAKIGAGICRAAHIALTRERLRKEVTP